MNQDTDISIRKPGMTSAPLENALVTQANLQLPPSEIETSEPAQVQAHARKPVKFLGITLSGPLANLAYKTQDFGMRWRRAAIEKTPRAIVNHSSNLIGSMQMVAEVLMFKSSGNNLVDEKNTGKPLHYVIDPPRNIVKATFQKSKLELKVKPWQKEFYTKMPQNIHESVASLKNLEKATIRDSMGGTVKLTNKWQARSGFAGICAMFVAMMLPDKKDTLEQTEADTELLKKHPVKYVGKRLYQALNPLEWWNHKRSFSGLGMSVAGILSVVSGFRQVEGKIIGQQKYMRNGWQIAGGLITTLGGSQLMLAVDNDSGWRNFGLTQMIRLITLPPSITARFKGHEQGSEWYLGGQAVFQTKNLVAASIGGAEKREDGTIVDHAAMRKEAASKVKLATLRRRQHKLEREATQIEQHNHEPQEISVPMTQVTQAHDIKHAMPKRVAEKSAQEITTAG